MKITKLKNSFFLRDHERKSSEQARQAARGELASLKSEIRVYEKEIQSLGDTFNPLIDAAQFVVDVQGDPPSIPQLLEALKGAQRKRFLRARVADLRRDRRSATAESLYYRYSICTISDFGGFQSYVQVGRGDSVTEAKKKAKERVPSRW